MQKSVSRIRQLFWIFVAMFLGTNVQAQLTIDDNVTATQLVEKLVGSGVITLNPQLICKTQCSGTFEGPTNLGIDSGILLVTGRAKTSGTLYGVDAPASNAMISTGAGPGDPELTQLVNGATTNNACILQFDFVPAGDTVKFEYVFGSEEYPNYVCSNFNDIFAFLISGPGIVSNTVLPTKRNIALVPGTTNIPIAINSVNSGTPGPGYQLSTCNAMGAGSPYTQYFVNNQNPPGQHIVFNGFTTVLTAIQNVSPCDTYTLKLAIADVSDGGFNSGVFIKAGSLKSVGLVANSQGMNITVSDTAFIVRGCPAAEVTIARDAASPLPLTIPYILEGDAVNGVDYQFLSGSVVIPADSTIGRINVRALPIPTTGANKIAKIKFLAPYTCGGNQVFVDSAIVSIQDSILISMSIGDTAICLGQQLDIDIETDTIYGPLAYEWIPTTGVNSPTIDYASINFAAPGLYEYQFKVRIPTQDTNCRASTAAFKVEVQDISVNIGNDSSICTYDQLQMFAEVFPQDTGNVYQYSWSPAGIFNNPDVVAPLILQNSTSTNVVVTVRTDIGCIGRDTMVLTVNPGEFAKALPSDTAICPGDEVRPVIMSTLSNTPLLPSYQYEWSPTLRMDDPTAMNQVLQPSSNTRYRLLVKNQFGCIDTSFVDVVVHPNATVSLPDSIVMWEGESYAMEPNTNAVNFSWFPVSGISNANISNPIFYPEVNTRYFYTATTNEGCVLKDSIDFIVKKDGVIDMPNAFNPNNTTFKPVFRGNFSLEAFEIYDRWGNKVFESNNISTGWDGTLKGKASPLGVYVYVIKLKNNSSGSNTQKTGSVTLIR